ncbi:hypothetical protein ACIBCT_39720 [Streptosporangium sp. NPDC050855]|uniref:hypothetical protein n=1 Tax=Streptosporangium sp. NPDC050855 TaxID=3366194 RepID=UPI00378DF43E
MLPRKSRGISEPVSGRRVGVLAVAAFAAILMTSAQPVNAAAAQECSPGSISQPSAAGAPGGLSAPYPDPSRRQYRDRGREASPYDRWRGRSQRQQVRPPDRYRGHRGGYAESRRPERERLTRSERLLRDLQNDPSFPEIIIREQ